MLWNTVGYVYIYLKSAIDQFIYYVYGTATRWSRHVPALSPTHPGRILYVLYTSGTFQAICIMSATCLHCPKIVGDVSATHP